MDSKDKGLTLSQKIVTDAVLRMNDDEKLEWLSRRYKEQGKIDQAFEIILSSISPTTDFSSLFEIINHVKDNKKRFDLIKTIDGKISETSDKFRYNAEGTETYCSALAKSVATFDTPEEVLSFLNLNTLNSEVIGSIINKMITFPLNKELISKIERYQQTKLDILKKEIESSPSFLAYKEKETNVNLLILGINQKFKQLNPSFNCRRWWIHENY